MRGRPRGSFINHHNLVFGTPDDFFVPGPGHAQSADPQSWARTTSTCSRAARRGQAGDDHAGGPPPTSAATSTGARASRVPRWNLGAYEDAVSAAEIRRWVRSASPLLAAGLGRRGAPDEPAPGAEAGAVVYDKSADENPFAARSREVGIL